MAPFWRSSIFFVTCIFLCTSFVHSDHFFSTQIPYFLKVSLSQLTKQINNTRDVVQQESVQLSQYFADSIPKNSYVLKALSNCGHLLDLTNDVLRRSQFLTNNPNDVDFGTGDWSSDLRVWLTATLDYQDTCLEGLDNDHVIIDGNIKKFISKLGYIKSLLKELLSMISPNETLKWVKSGHQQASNNGVPTKPNVVVATDGSGNFKSINDAIQASPSNSNTPYVIYIRAGVYKEYVRVPLQKRNIVLRGDGIGKTILTGDRSDSGGFNTMASAILGIDGMNFMAMDLTIENKAGPKAGQAVALYNSGDLSVFYNCEMKGYQDTLFAYSNRQFYKNCIISGSVDFIFGDAIAVFQDCQIISRLTDGPANVITAESRGDPNKPTGFVFQFCDIKAETVNGKFTPVHLGRPWRSYARVVYMQCEMDSCVEKEGWTKLTEGAESKVYYAEYMNTGLRSNFADRVKWPGVVKLDKTQAQAFTVAKFLNGQRWLSSTGVPFVPGF